MSSKSDDKHASKSDDKSGGSASQQQQQQQPAPIAASGATAASIAALWADDDADLNSVDLQTLKAMIDALPPTTAGMSQATARRHERRVDALMAAYQNQARAQLYAMQQQKRAFLKFLKQNYKPLHPHLYSLAGWKFEPEFLRLVTSKEKKERATLLTPAKPSWTAADGTQSATPSAAAASATTGDAKSKTGGGGGAGGTSPVFVFDMLTAQTCSELCAEIRHYEQWMNANKQKIDRPNTMNKYGVILDDIGFASCLRELMHTYISPLSALVYGDTGGLELDAHHGFVVEYEIGKDRKLDLHVDDAEITLNLSLGEEFTGGGLEFAGARCTYHQMTEPTEAEVYRVEHRTGQAYLHRGRHRHQATPITSGHRLNLIIWCISTNYREREHELATCRDWCGYHATAHASGNAPPSDYERPNSFMCSPDFAPAAKPHVWHTCSDDKCSHADHSQQGGTANGSAPIASAAPPTAAAAAPVAAPKAIVNVVKPTDHAPAGAIDVLPAASAAPKQ